MSSAAPVNLFASLEAQQWRDQSWLNRFPPLNIHSVYDYFKNSQFFQKSCNNELLRQQNKEASVAALRTLQGLEYQIREIPSGVDGGGSSTFLIYQQNRRDANAVEVVQVYCVLDGSVYPMPSLHEVFSNQLLHIVHLLQSSVDDLSRVTRYDTAAMRWEFDAAAAATCAAVASIDGPTARQGGGAATVPLPSASLLPPRPPSDDNVQQHPDHAAIVNELLAMLAR